MDKEQIKQLATDVNNVAATCFQSGKEHAERSLFARIKNLEKALEYARSFIDGYGSARIKEGLGREGMDAVLKEIDKIAGG